MIVPDEADTAATFAGFASNLGPTQLTGDVIDGSGGASDTFPKNVVLVIGNQGIGTFTDLVKSDDSFIRFFSQPQGDNEAISIQANFTANLPTNVPESLRITMESSVNSPNLQQTIEIFDFVGADWEVLSTSNSTLTDSTIEAEATGDLTRFVGPANLVFSRVSWQATGPVIHFPWAADIDVFKWTTTN